MPHVRRAELKSIFRWQPRLASLLLFCVYLWVLGATLPDGINQSFSAQLLRICVLALVLALLISLRASAASTDSTDPAPGLQKFPLGDLVLLSLPLTPVVQYLLLNQESMDLMDNLGLLLFSMVFFALALLLLPWLLRRWLSYPLSLLLGLALGYTLTNMATLARSSNWHLSGEFVLQLGLWLVTLTVCMVLYRVDRTALRGLALCFLLGTAFHSAWQGPSAVRDEDSGTPSTISQPDGTSNWSRTFNEQQIKHRPNIFLMTYDSYVGDETLRQYGIDNAAQEQYLQDAGFQIYPGVYSVAAASKSTMSRVLGTSSRLKGVAGFSPVLRVLKSQGYTTMGIFKDDYFFKGVGVGYDRSFPPPSRPSLGLARAIVEGQFRHDVSFADVPHAEFVRNKRSAIETPSAAPKFLYTHSGPGHSQNSGKCLDDEVALFRARLAVANQEMRSDLAAIQASHPEAIIIVNGDHGPYLTKNCAGLKDGGYRIEEVTPLDIQDRFGTFLAIRWPDSRQRYPEDQLLVLQDVFPAVFSYLYQQPMADRLRAEAAIRQPWNDAIGGIEVESGVIIGGSYAGKRLYESSSLVQR